MGDIPATEMGVCFSLSTPDFPTLSLACDPYVYIASCPYSFIKKKKNHTLVHI